MGEDDYSWLMNDGSLGDGGGGLDPSLLPLIPTPQDQLYTPMEPFNPASPEYGNYAINFDGTSVPQLNIGGGKGGNSNSSLLGQVLKLFGLDGGNGGGLLPLLSMLGIGAGAYLNRSASQDAAKQMSDAVNGANNRATQIFADQGALYKPYYDMGTAAIDKLRNTPQSNLAGNFVPLGTGRGIVPGTPGGNPITLGKLAGR